MAKLGPHNMETVYSTRCPGREELTGSLFIVWGAGIVMVASCISVHDIVSWSNVPSPAKREGPAVRLDQMYMCY